MELQPRDLRIFEQIGELGTLSTDLIRLYHFPRDKTGRACQQRLKLLVEAGLLVTRRLMAVDCDGKTGSQPSMFFLTPAGADVVERETGVVPKRVTRSQPKAFTLRHRIEVVNARLSFDHAAEFHHLPDIEWIMEQDTKSESRGQSPSDNLILTNRYRVNSKPVSFRPDAALHLQIPAKSKGNSHNSLLAYIELDRSTEGHKQWRQKLAGITAFFESKSDWKAHWPEVKSPTIRLFVLCKSMQRLRNLAATTSESPVAEYVRFTTFPLSPQTILTEAVWLDCQGKVFRIFSG